MRKAALVIALVAAISTPAMGQSLIGTWTATAHLEGFKTSETLTVAKADEGYLIAGKAIDAPPAAPEAGPGTDVVIQGDKLSYKRRLLVGADGIEITYTGMVSGDTFTGTADLGGMTVPYTGVRVPADK